MTRDKHALNLGTLIGNLQSLETQLRVAIAQHGGTPELDLRALRVGDKVPVDGITSWRSLGQRIDAFNRFASKGDRLDRSDLEGLRDQLAHGLTVAWQDDPPLQLFKFGREQAGTVTVEAVIEMSAHWFFEQHELVAAAIGEVRKYVQ